MEPYNITTSFPSHSKLWTLKSSLRPYCSKSAVTAGYEQDSSVPSQVVTEQHSSVPSQLVTTKIEPFLESPKAILEPKLVTIQKENSNPKKLILIYSRKPKLVTQHCQTSKPNSSLEEGSIPANDLDLPIAFKKGWNLVLNIHFLN